jgi:hypothetical protein
MKNLKIRRLLRQLHRDLGYFIAGMTLMYCLSGIFLNHQHDFNPDYKIYNVDFQTPVNSQTRVDASLIKDIFAQLDYKLIYKKHFTTNRGEIKIFIENGEVVINPATGKATLNYLQRRPVLFEMNRLHRATVGTLWKWVSDAMAVTLLFVAVSGLFLLKGKRSFGRWGWGFTIAGIVIPLLFALFYI